MIRYIVNLSTGRLILWCYLVWYLVIAVRYFDPSFRLWLSSLGISIIIGAALVISASSTNKGSIKLEGWQVFRLYLTPFCVSSFAALIKEHGFILVFSPKWEENLLAVEICGLLCAFVFTAKRFRH